MPTQKIKQAEFTFALADPDITDLPSIQERIAKATKSDTFAHLLQHVEAEAAQHLPPTAHDRVKGVDLTFSGTAGSSGGKPSGSGTVGVTIHF